VQSDVEHGWIQSARTGQWLRALKRRTRRSLEEFARVTLYGRGSKPWAPMEFAPGHFHSPLPATTDIAAYRTTPPPDPTAIRAVDLDVKRQVDLLRHLKPFIDAHPRWSESVSEGGTALRFHFGNDWFGGFDPIVYCALLREFAPRQIVEVGSGWSTAALLDAYEGRTLPRVTLVEPHPERLFRILRDGDRERLDLLECRLQDVPLDVFERLENDDVLFVDSTHVSKLGSDVNYLFFEILPRLAVGVLVHLHDVAYPFEYDAQFVDQGYGWNESYLLRAFLEFNTAYEIVLWNDMLATACEDFVREELPELARHRCDGAEGSIWLRRVS
jgi:hypothetical protein